MKIIVKDIINSKFAISNDKGKLLYPIILEGLKKNEDVILDFSGIVSTISTFFNSFYAILFKEFDENYLELKLKFINAKEVTEMQIHEVKKNALSKYKKG